MIVLRVGGSGKISGSESCKASNFTAANILKQTGKECKVIFGSEGWFEEATCLGT